MSTLLLREQHIGLYVILQRWSKHVYGRRLEELDYNEVRVLVEKIFSREQRVILLHLLDNIVNTCKETHHNL